jgi:hypothetical protein
MMRAGPARTAAISLLLWLAFAGAVCAQRACDICSIEVQEFSVFEDKFHHRNQFVCDKCIKLTTRCLTCKVFVLPARGLVLPDGRVFCPEDSKDIVMDENRAGELFAEARQEIQTVLKDYPPVPDKNMQIHLVTREEFNKEYRRTPSIDDPSRLLGLTMSRFETNEAWSHEIYLLHGLTRDEFLAVSAHEYTHTWMTERNKQHRQLHKDTLEGFCELMAHKFTSKMKFTNATQRILDNDYTHGQIQALLAAEEKLRFHRLVEWIADGVDSWVDKDKLNRLTALREPDEPSAELSFNPPPQAVTPVPDTLVLKGISGSARRRFALVNNATLQEGEEARVRVGTSNILVRCLAILDDRVRLQLAGQTNAVELRLGGN